MINWLQLRNIVKANKIEIKNTVGAGDTMLAAFIYGLINKKSYEESLEFASKLVEEKLKLWSNNR